MKVYFIPGLAADERVFRHIRVPSSHEAVFLRWIPPAKNEPLPNYALRLAENINTVESFALAGLSFGGMIATEIARSFPPVRTILISSIPASTFLPRYYSWAAALRLHQVMPISLIRSIALIKRKFTRESSEDKELLREMIRNSDPAFIRWAMSAILRWKQPAALEGAVHIHGNKDLILPIRYLNPTHVIPGAGHLMVMTRAAEINRILKEVLSPGEE